MAEFMHLTPAEYSRFMEAYEITKAGADNYYRRKNTKNFLMNFPDNFSILSQDRPPYITADNTFFRFSSCAALSTQLELNYVIRNILSEESHDSQGKIALFLQPDYEFLFNLLASLNLGCSLKISQILCEKCRNSYKRPRAIQFKIFQKYFSAVSEKFGLSGLLFL